MKYAFIYEIIHADRKTGPDKSHLIVHIVNCSGCIKISTRKIRIHTRKIDKNH